MQAREPTTLTRFIDAAGDPLEARIGKLLREAERPEPLGPVALARVRSRLSQSHPSSVPPLRFAVLLATGVLAGTGFAVASYGVARFLEPGTPERSVAAPAPAPDRPALVPPRKAPEAAPPLVEAAPSAEIPTSAPAPSPEASSSTLGRESELLSRALSKLRRDRDAGAALLLLDEHARSFPTGTLRLEADVARVDALLALRRDADALLLLERLPVDRVGRGAELLVIRGELLAKRDPKLALVDFDRALAKGLPRDLEERALFGRAASRLRVGDEAGGRADLETYLSKYPDGRFAEQARARAPGQRHQQ